MPTARIFHPMTALMEETPEVRKHMVDPGTCVQLREKHMLTELLDERTNTSIAHHVHINICEITDPHVRRQYLVHACIGDDMLNAVYEFPFFVPSVPVLRGILLQDFSYFVGRVAIEMEFTRQ